MSNTTNEVILRNDGIGKEIAQWFGILQDRDNSDKGVYINGRAERAKLRRISDPWDALVCGGYRYLAKKLGTLVDLERSESDQLALAIFTSVAVYVKSNNTKKSFAAQLGEKVSSDRPCLSELRFNRLLRSATPEEFSRQLIRAVKIRGDSGVNLLSLADGIFLWMREYQAKLAHRSPSTKPFERLAVRWACEYFQATQ